MREKLSIWYSQSRLSRNPACTVSVCWSDRAKRCSMRSCGVQPHRLPPKANVGVASDAKDVGDRGEMNNESCPATKDVFFQSKRRLAVCRRTIPKLAAFPVLGNPPEKSS